MRGFLQAPACDGKVPILFLDDPDAFVRIKGSQGAGDGETVLHAECLPFGGGVERCTPWTKDCEYLFVVRVLRGGSGRRPRGHARGRGAVDRALAYVVRHNMADGLWWGPTGGIRMSISRMPPS